MLVQCFEVEVQEVQNDFQRLQLVGCDDGFDSEAEISSINIQTQNHFYFYIKYLESCRRGKRFSTSKAGQVGVDVHIDFVAGVVVAVFVFFLQPAR
jgi:hypothetical protein